MIHIISLKEIKILNNKKIITLKLHINLFGLFFLSPFFLLLKICYFPYEIHYHQKKKLIRLTLFLQRKERIFAQNKTEIIWERRGVK